MRPRSTRLTEGHPPALAPVVERNIQALLARRHEEDNRRGLQDRLADAMTRFTGSIPFVYIHLAVFGLWITLNLPWAPPDVRFDPQFTVLAMAASVEAIFLSTFVLVSQNRLAALADQRADLDLQVSLLGEHEVTHLIRLVTAMARRMGVAEARDPELAELAEDVQPEKVLDEMEHTAQGLADQG